MLPLSKPDIRFEDIELANKVMLSGNLVQGEKVTELEKEFSSLHEVPYAIAVANGTAALHLSLLALGIGPGDEVLVTSYSFIASANAIVLAGATPVFCDTGNDSYTMDHRSLLSLISKKTKALIVVHEFGMPARIEDILSIANRFGIPVIEDAACALGSIVGEKRLGSFGKISCFSFHPRKLITCGEGGMILTSDKQVDKFLRSMRSHGLDTSNPARSYSRAGFNYRMSDISASLLLGQLSRLSEIVSKRNQIAAQYFRKIINSALKLPSTDSNAVYNWQTFPVRLQGPRERDLFIAHSQKSGISAIQPAQFIPSEPYYLSHGEDISKYPNAYALHSQSVALPMYELMNEHDVNLVIEVCNEF